MGKLLREVLKITVEVEALSQNPNFKSDDDAEETVKSTEECESTEEDAKMLEIIFPFRLSCNS